MTPIVSSKRALQKKEKKNFVQNEKKRRNEKFQYLFHKNIRNDKKKEKRYLRDT